MDLNDVSFLQQFENISELEGTKYDNEDNEWHDTQVEYEESSQEDSIRDQLP